MSISIMPPHQLAGKMLAAFPWLVLASSVVLTALVWETTHQQTIDNSQAEFEYISNRLIDSIDDRVKANVQVLRSVVSLFAASDTVTREDFRAFVSNLHLDDRYPGIQGVGFAKVIPPDQLAAHIKTIRAEGFPDYRVHPDTPRDFYTSIIFLEPFDWRNQRAFGYDMFSQSVRNQAMARARDTGLAALAGKVILLQETEHDMQAGTLLYVPIYRNGAPLGSTAERRANLEGWAFSPLRMKNLFVSLIEREHPGLEKKIAFSVYDGDSATPDALLFENFKPDAPLGRFGAVRHVELAGQKWTVVIHSVPGFDQGTDIPKEYIVLIAGTAVSLLLVLLSGILTRSQLRINAALEQVTQVKEEITRNQNELQTIYDTASVAIFFVDPQGIIRRANQCMVEMFACPLSALVGSEYVAHIHPEERDNGRVKMQALLDSDIPSVNLERHYFRNDHTEFWGHLTGIRLLDAAGRTLGLVGVIADITELKEKTAALEQHRDHLEELVTERTQELVTAKLAAEAASRAKTSFLANMSHELRTPMHGIMGMTTLALRRATDPKQIDQLKKVEQSSRHLLQIINDILDITKIEAERITIEHRPFQVTSLLDDVHSLMDQKILDKGLKLHIALEPHLSSLTLLGDPLRLIQVLINYMGNALKFTEQGEIALRMRIENETGQDVLLRIEVEDTGIGIAQEALPRIFTAFEQADNSTTRKYGGTGLGLAISKRLAILMGGDAGVSSVPGQGSTFWFTARLGKATEGAVESKPVDTPEQIQST